VETDSIGILISVHIQVLLHPTVSEGVSQIFEQRALETDLIYAFAKFP
jgi:hypothetical protein